MARQHSRFSISLHFLLFVAMLSLPISYLTSYKILYMNMTCLLVYIL